jgi:hypothetical protein
MRYPIAEPVGVSNPLADICNLIVAGAHRQQSDVASVVAANSISMSLNALGSVEATMPTSAPVTVFQFRRFGRRILARSDSASVLSRWVVISLLRAPSHVTIIKTSMRFLRMRRKWRNASQAVSQATDVGRMSFEGHRARRRKFMPQ